LFTPYTGLWAFKPNKTNIKREKCGDLKKKHAPDFMLQNIDQSILLTETCKTSETSDTVRESLNNYWYFVIGIISR
jgi:hypothetical protein